VNGERRTIEGEPQLYASDVQRPGMLCGKVLRPPALGAELSSCEHGSAAALPGVTALVDGTFAGVAAADGAVAARALAALRPQWRRAEPVSSASLFDDLRRPAAAARDGSGRRGRGDSGAAGSIDAGLAAAAVRLERTYTVAYIAHVPRLDTVLLDRKDLPSAGAGESPLIAIAPAIANAIFAACGTRLRGLPLAPGGVVPA
jgi:CO/xanthine dehydrogenase Mo-binding subunit